MPTNSTKPVSVTQLASEIIDGKKKLSEVPAFRQKPVQNLMKTVKPNIIKAMAEKESGAGVVAKRQSDSSRFMAGASRVRQVRSS